MRDNRKDWKYFKRYLEYQYSRIKKKKSKLEDADADKKQRILVSLTGYELDLLKAEFSAGTSKENLKISLNEAIKIAEEYSDITYEDVLNLLSLAVILDDSSETKNLIDKNKEKIDSDRLLKFLAYYIEENKILWDEKIVLRDEFKGLDLVFSSNDKEEKLNSYLKSWYEEHAGYGWYDSHLGDSDTYCGYWSFESAAIVVILGLNDSKLKESEYYPCL